MLDTEAEPLHNSILKAEVATCLYCLQPIMRLLSPPSAKWIHHNPTGQVCRNGYTDS